MKLEQLRDLVAIVEHGSLRGAARRLDLQQPALTRSVRALERELGVPLFERNARGMTLTPVGVAFHRRASTIIHEARRACDEIAQSTGDGQGAVVVGLSIMPHIGMLPEALPVFQRRYPNVTLDLVEGLFPDIEAGLRSGHVDFYLGAAPRLEPASGLVSEQLFTNTRAIVARKGHPLVSARSLHELQHASWATTSIDYNAAEDLNHTFLTQGLQPPKVLLKTRTALSMLVGVANTDLLAMVPAQWEAFSMTRDILAVIPIREFLPAPPIVLIYRPDLPLTPAAEHFCDVLRRYAP